MRVKASSEEFSQKLFFKLSNRLTDVKMPYGAMDFRMMSRQMVDSILELSEVQRFSKGIFSWVGFNTKWIAYKTVDRQLGQTTWKFSSLFKYAIEGITSPDGRVLGKMAHSERRGDSVAINIYGEQDIKIFESGVEYFR